MGKINMGGGLIMFYFLTNKKICKSFVRCIIFVLNQIPFHYSLPLYAIN
jgi:hypothetical protein